MKDAIRLDKAIPVLAALDLEKMLGFYERLGFTRIWEMGVQRDGVEIFFWKCRDRHIAENTSCRITVHNIEALYAEYEPLEVVHPNALLETKPWGQKEFGILDLDGNLIIFAERAT